MLGFQKLHLPLNEEGSGQDVVPALPQRPQTSSARKLAAKPLSAASVRAPSTPSLRHIHSPASAGLQQGGLGATVAAPGTDLRAYADIFSADTTPAASRITSARVPSTSAHKRWHGQEPHVQDARLANADGGEEQQSTDVVQQLRAMSARRAAHIHTAQPADGVQFSSRLERPVMRRWASAQRTRALSGRLLQRRSGTAPSSSSVNADQSGSNAAALTRPATAAARLSPERAVPTVALQSHQQQQRGAGVSASGTNGIATSSVQDVVWPRCKPEVQLVRSTPAQIYAGAAERHTSDAGCKQNGAGRLIANLSASDSPAAAAMQVQLLCCSFSGVALLVARL
jgi:hypothetical protein